MRPPRHRRPSGPVILFLIDNSASLPPLDPSEKRVAALEKMFTFLQGQRYRLILFGGRKEIAVDDVSQYRNDGQWTDFYAAFEKAKELAAGYPKETELRMVLLTDAIADPDPADWKDLPPVPTRGRSRSARPSSCWTRCGSRSTSCWSADFRARRCVDNREQSSGFRARHGAGGERRRRVAARAVARRLLQ